MGGGAERRRVRVLGREYRVRTNASEEQLERAVELLEQTMRRVAPGLANPRDAAVIAGLGLAGELLELREEKARTTRRVEQLMARVQQALGELPDDTETQRKE